MKEKTTSTSTTSSQLSLESFINYKKSLVSSSNNDSYINSDNNETDKIRPKRIRRVITKDESGKVIITYKYV